jgi:hypothetical protein
MEIHVLSKVARLFCFYPGSAAGIKTKKFKS